MVVVEIPIGDGSNWREKVTDMEKDGWLGVIYCDETIFRGLKTGEQ